MWFSRRLLMVFLCFFLVSGYDIAYSWYTLAGRFFISRLSLTTTLARVKNLNLPSGTSQVKFFIQRHGKWILATAMVGSLLRELENVSLCTRPSYYLTCNADNRVCGCLHTLSLGYLFSVSCQILSGDGTVISVPGLAIYRNNNFIGVIPKPGVYENANNLGASRIAITANVEIYPCDSTEIQEIMNSPREVRIRVYPNPLDFFQPEVIDGSLSLRTLQRLRDEVLSDTSIPLITNPADIFPDLDNLDIRVVGDDVEVVGDVPDSAREDIGQREGEGSEGSEEISVPDLDASFEQPVKRSFPVELLHSVVQSHPLLRVLSSISIDTSGGSCELSSVLFTISFCDWTWVLNIMGAVIVFVATLLPFVYKEG